MKDKENISNSDINNLTNVLRKNILRTSNKAKIPHLGSCLSCIDILTYLYWKELNIDPFNPKDQNRDRFILSKGHAAPALIQVLAERGFFPKKELTNFGKSKSVFHEHPPKPGYIPGIEAATGSLGHGLPMAVGMALAGKIKQSNYRCYVLLSDGECNEGSIWEAAMFAAANDLNNLICFLDFNKWQATGRSKEIMKLEPLVDKWKSFNWHVQRIDGHNLNEISSSLEIANKNKTSPNMIIADTIKGKGISFMEDDNNWHYRVPNELELELALKELELK